MKGRASSAFDRCPARAAALALALVLWFDIPVVAQAEDATPVPTPPHNQPLHHQKITVDERVQRLTQSLALTPEQAIKVRTILTRRQAAIEHLQVDSSLSAVDRVHHYRAVDLHTVDQIKAVLTEEQLQKSAPRPQQPPAPGLAPLGPAGTPSAVSTS
jgi:Spy/CpxP family protein refolding chaperone